MKIPHILLLLIAGSVLVSSCRTTKHLEENQWLLSKNKIEGDNSGIDKSELEAIIRQQPNRKLLRLIPFHLWVYYLSNSGKENKFKNWLKNTIGEEPVLVDPVLTQKSSNQIHLYLKNKGYFNNTVTDTTIYGAKKAEVIYKVNSNSPYTIRKLDFIISDTSLTSAVQVISRKTLIRRGSNYDVDVLQKERERIEKEMKDLGYFKFTKEYILFRIDSALNIKRVDIQLNIKNPDDSRQLPQGRIAPVKQGHEKYYINNVYIDASYDPKMDNSDTATVEGYYFLNSERIKFKPNLLLKSVYINKGALYTLKNTEYTYNRIASLKTFKFINIQYEEAGIDSGKNMLDCHINLTPSPKQSLATELEGTHRTNNYGIGGNLVYRNKNAFRGAEVLQVKMKGALEMQQSLWSNEQNGNPFDSPDQIGGTPFNTVEYGPELTLFLPDLMFFRKLKGLPKYRNPTTNFTTAFSHQKRPDFTRDIGTVSYGYSWRGKGNTSYSVLPVDFSLVKIDLKPFFERQLTKSGNPFLINQYTAHLIPASRVSLIHNTQEINKFKNFMFFKTNVEWAGNLLRLLGNNLLDASQNEETGFYEIAGIPYAQYVKTDYDLRFYTVLNKHSSMVYRAFAGVGVPLKNLNVLPFEKAYFAGGANGLRAWQVRRIGPGSLPDSLYTPLVHSGDIMIEGNVEYRFDIMKYLQGAAFVDVGNIWLLREEEQRPNAHFEPNRFFKEFAAGAGLGARFDFSFFIIRMDAALQIHDPAKIPGERWVVQSKTFYNSMSNTPYRPQVNLNFGIGYPF